MSQAGPLGVSRGWSTLCGSYLTPCLAAHLHHCHALTFQFLEAPSPTWFIAWRMVNTGATIQNFGAFFFIHISGNFLQNWWMPWNPQKLTFVRWHKVSLSGLRVKKLLKRVFYLVVVTIRVIFTADLCVVLAMLEQQICVLGCTVPSHPQTRSRQVVTEKHWDGPWQVTASNTTWHLISGVFLLETHIHTLMSMVPEGSNNNKRGVWWKHHRRFSTLKLPYCNILNSMEIVDLFFHFVYVNSKQHWQIISVLSDSTLWFYVYVPSLTLTNENKELGISTFLWVSF